MAESDSQQSQLYEPTTPFKTITHEPPTRYPTSSKKNQPDPSFHRTNPELPRKLPSSRPHSLPSRTNSLRQSISTLKTHKYHCLQAGRYKQASQIEQQISRTRSLLGKREIRRVQKNSKAEKKSIRWAYEHEIAFFQSAWNSYFQRFKELQRTKISQFKRQEAAEVQRARDKLRRKCHSLRHASKEILELEKEEKYHLKHGNLQELSLARRQKKKMIERTRQERKEMIDRWTKMEGEELSRYQSKKYSILMGRMEERRQDQEKSFMLERKRLKQKYKNVLSQLRHEQRMTLHFVTRCTQPSQL